MNLPFRVDLKDKVIVVTGGTGVLGSLWVDALAECGAKIAILSRNISSATKKANEVIANGGIAIGIEADVTDKESLIIAHKTILSIFGPCDILINGAGGNDPRGTTSNEYLSSEDLTNETSGITTFFSMDEIGLKNVFDTNFLGILLPSQEFSKDMIGKKGCSILNITSVSANIPLTKIPAYSAAKASVTNFTKWLAVHLSKAGIRVNAIAPGFFLTKQNEKLLKNPDGTLSDRSKKILNNTPMNRFGDPKELIGALLFLVNEDASGFVNGTIISVDGGFQAYSGV
jgi:Dehydrogenases with different specificities (related to short-chain alcohol dehydrogenases)